MKEDEDGLEGGSEDFDFALVMGQRRNFRRGGSMGVSNILSCNGEENKLWNSPDFTRRSDPLQDSHDGLDPFRLSKVF